MQANVVKREKIVCARIKKVWSKNVNYLNKISYFDTDSLNVLFMEVLQWKKSLINREGCTGMSMVWRLHIQI